MRPILRSIVHRLPFTPITLLKFGIVAGVVVVVAGVGYLASRTHKPEFLAAAALVPLAGLALFQVSRLEYGILAIILTAGLVRFTLPTGTNSEIVASLVVTVLIVGLWIINMLVVEKRLWLKPIRTNTPLLIFMGVCIISYFWSNAFRDVLVVLWGSFPFVQLAALFVMLLLPTAFLLVSNIIEEVVWLRWLAWLIIGLGTVALVSYQCGLPIGKIFNTRGIFPTWVIALTFAFSLYHEELKPWLRIGLLGVCGFWLWWQLGKGFIWMSGWAPAMVAVVVITWQRSKKLFLLLIILGLIYIGANFDALYHKIVVESEQEGDFQRLDLWRTNLELVRNHPLFGTGPAGYAVYYMSYHPENARSTHNNYFDIIAQTGVVGFLTYLWFWAALAYTGYELSQKLNHQRNFESAYATAMLGGCAGAIASGMLGDWIIPFAYNQTIEGFDHSIYAWVLLGGMVSLWHIVRQREARADLSDTRTEHE